MSTPFISICIPAYKKASYLQRLLDSLKVQTYRQFEVIVTDDSPDTEVETVCRNYQRQLPLNYHRNATPLGTPENWNAAIRLAGSEWIKLMHDDDWFRDEHSLATFASAIEKNPTVDFFFSAYENHYLEKNYTQIVRPPESRLKQLGINPVTLFSRNVIGPPSVVMHRNDGVTFYDPKIKWVVDIDFYIRHLNNRHFHYIDLPLVNVGISSQQVTVDCFRKRQVEIPETFHLFEKTGFDHLRNVLVYDGWWRLLRNLEIRKPEDITGSGFSGAVPSFIRSMISLQAKFPLSLLRFGPVSKGLMFLNYLYNRKRLR